MKTTILTCLASALVLISCDRTLDIKPEITATLSPSIQEFERPVVTVSRTEALGSYIPCQAIIDGEPVTILNAAGTTLLDMASQEIRLPRLSPGKHEIELVFGKARKLYRDAEAACGERVSSTRLSLEVKASAKRVLALSFPRTDVDCYLFMPEDGTAVNCNTGEKKSIADMAVLQAEYTVNIYPFSCQEDGFAVTEVGSRLNVEAKETLIGNGIVIRAGSAQGNSKSDMQFTITAGGKDITIQVAE